MNIPLSKISFSESDVDVLGEVLRSGWIMQGPKVAEFEKRIAEYCGAPHAVATSSGTTALHLALLSLDLQPDDEVVVPSFSWIASANAIRYVGARPVFCDIDPETYNMTANTIQAVMTSRTRAILLVHQFGMPCEIDSIRALSRERSIPIIEDAACAVGSLWRNQPIGGLDLSVSCCLSFHPRKVLTTGEGGMILTRDESEADRFREWRNHGMPVKPNPMPFTRLGYNYRMTDLQASLGINQLSRLKDMLERRRALAQHYFESLSAIPGIRLPRSIEGALSNWQTFMIRLTPECVAKRDDLVMALQKAGISTRKSIDPIHLQSFYSNETRLAPLPHTEAAASDGLILPLYDSLSESEQSHIIDSLKHLLM